MHTVACMEDPADSRVKQNGVTKPSQFVSNQSSHHAEFNAPEFSVQHSQLTRLHLLLESEFSIAQGGLSEADVAIRVHAVRTSGSAPASREDQWLREVLLSSVKLNPPTCTLTGDGGHEKTINSDVLAHFHTDSLILLLVHRLSAASPDQS